MNQKKNWEGGLKERKKNRKYHQYGNPFLQMEMDYEECGHGA